jgi:hypothetical protein
MDDEQTELVLTFTDKRHSICHCGNIIYCQISAPHSDLCEPCYWAMQDQQDKET